MDIEETLKKISRRLDKDEEKLGLHDRIISKLMDEVLAIRNLLSGKDIVDIPGEDHEFGHDKAK